MKETVIMLDDRRYTASFPNMKQFSDIEQRKMILSDGRYPLLAMNSNTEGGKIALDFIDAVAYFSVLIPTIVGDCGFKTYIEMMEMDYTTAQILIQAYNSQFVPFYDKFVERSKIPFRTESTTEQPDLPEAITGDQQ